MFDQRTTTTINADAAAAVSQPPVRIMLGVELHWLRPSNVLRIETETRGEKPHYLNIWLSDGKRIVHPCMGMKLTEFYALADEVASKLWPA